VWHDTSLLEPYSVMGQRYTDKGELITEFVIAYENSPPRNNAQPDAAYDPINDRYLVVWIYDVYGNGNDWDVMGCLMPYDGPSASYTPIPLGYYSSNQWEPRVAYASTQQEFLVTWWNEGTPGIHSYISVQRVSSAGMALGANLDVAYGNEDREYPDLAYNQARNEYLITYQLEDGGGDIYAVRMSALGSVIGGEFSIADWPDAETAPAVAATAAGNEWAVAWQSDNSGESEAMNIYVRRLWVDGSGIVQQAAPVKMQATAYDEREPDIAVFPSNQDYLVVWEQQYWDGTIGVSGQALDTANVKGDFIDLRYLGFAEFNDSSRPALAAGPVSYFGVWEQERDNAATYQDIRGVMVFDYLFRDDFETGDLSAWSSSAP